MKETINRLFSKFNLLQLTIMICTTLVSTLSFGQAGNAPMQSLPNFPGPLAIDGFIQRQGVNGDWQAGPGGATNVVFNNSCVPLVPLAFYFTDLFNDQTNDEIFDGGNKLNDNPNVWGWRSQKPPAKDDINTSMVFIALNPADNHIWLAISGDRMSTNGTSYIDFEFYQNSITRTNGETPPGAPVLGGTGGFVSTGPHNGRTVGDISITLEFTGGGSFATVKYQQWQAGSEAGTYDYFNVTPAPGTAFAAANAGEINVPCGAFGATTYAPLQFVEGAIDLTALIGGTGLPNECGGLPFETLFIKTKSSASNTADLKDFIEPFQINVCFDRTAPVINCPNTLNLGCNPTIPPPSGATASDNCDGVVIPVSADGPVQSSGCNRTMVRTWRAQDGCGNTATCGQIINWTQDNTPPVFSGSFADVDLGCNPANPTGSLGGASASDACGATTISQSDGSVSSAGCNRAQTRTFTARDGCGNTSSVSRTVRWVADPTPPVFTGSYGDVNLGCNPGNPDASLGSASATDGCGAVTITQSDGSVASDGCNRSRTRTFTARDACNNTATVSRTVRWIADATPPAFTGSYGDVNLGCNPGNPDGSLGSASATDACGAVTITQQDGSVVSDGCNRSRTRTFTATDGCGNTATISRTVRWILDVTPPAFSGSFGDVSLGCNPANPDGSLGSAGATDACGAVTISQQDGSVGSDGCNRSRTRTFTARDGCGNTASISRTVRWIADAAAPVFTGGYGDVVLGCNPENPSGSLGSASATDACGAVTITQQDGSVVSEGCNRSQTRTFTARDGCSNTATISRTVRWSTSPAPPTFTGSYGDVNLGCNPANPDGSLGTATATSACGTPGITSSDGPVVSDGCNRSRTRTFTANDGCNNTATVSRTVRWIADVTPPAFTGSYGDVNLGCNPANPDGSLGSASATDACGAVTISQSDGSVASDGCNRSRTRTFTARDGCGNTATISRTVRWIADGTAPVFTGSYGDVNLGCNPANPDGSLGTAAATDACGPVTISQSDGSVQSSGCNRSRARTFVARDGCGNTSSVSRTVRWTADVTAPVFTPCPSNVDVDCNVPIPTASVPTASDACGTPTVTQTGTTDNAADCATGFSRVVTRTWTARDACGNTSTCTQTIRVRCCPAALCTYTQGAYGSEGGKMCDGENGGFSTQEFINASLANWGGSFTVGKPGHSVLVNSAQCVLDKLPGGGPAKELVAGDINLCNFTPLQPNGGVRNILLAQTITLGLNLGIENSQLGNFALQVGTLATQEIDGGCGGDTPLERICHYNVLAPFNLISVENQYTFRTFTQEVIDAIPGANTVANLYELANRALANVDGVEGSEGGASLDAINNAVSSVNEVFDGCKISIGWDVAPCPPIDPTPGDGRVATTTTPTLTVTAYPNPYQDNFSLQINSPVTGEAQVGIYTIDGVKIGELKRDVVANRNVSVPFNVPAAYRTRIVYAVSISGSNYTAKGIVLSPNEP